MAISQNNKIILIPAVIILASFLALKHMPFNPYALAEVHTSMRLKSFIENRPGHDVRYAIDASKIKRELGWVPEETFLILLRHHISQSGLHALPVTFSHNLFNRIAALY